MTKKKKTVKAFAVLTASGKFYRAWSSKNAIPHLFKKFVIPCTITYDY